MKIRVDIGKIKTRELLECEESLSATIDLMSKCAVDGEGVEIPPETARGELEEMTIEELLGVRDDFLTAFSRMMKGKR